MQSMYREIQSNPSGQNIGYRADKKWERKVRREHGTSSQCQCQAKGLGLKPGLSREPPKKGLDYGSDTTIKTSNCWQLYEIFCTSVPSLNDLVLRHFYSHFINEKVGLLPLTPVLSALHLTSFYKFTMDVMQDVVEMAYFPFQHIHALYSEMCVQF